MQHHHISYSYERSLRTFVGTACIIALSLYGYLIATTIFYTIARQEALHATADIRVSLGTLEGEYASLQSAVSMKEAGTLGLVTLASPLYINAETSVARAH